MKEILLATEMLKISWIVPGVLVIVSIIVLYVQKRIGCYRMVAIANILSFIWVGIVSGFQHRPALLWLSVLLFLFLILMTIIHWNGPLEKVYDQEDEAY